MRARGTRGPRWTTLALGLLAVLTALSGLPAPVGAEPGEDGADTDPPGFYGVTPHAGWMTERAADRIHDFAQIGNTVYVAGTFSGVRPSRSGPVTYQGNLAAFDAVTGELIAGFAPDIDSTVYSLAIAPDGSSLYAGGAFTSVNGQNHVRIAKLDPVTGAPDTGFDSDAGGGSVRSVVYRDGTLYVGGNFSAVEGLPRPRTARVDALTGAVDPTWAPDVDGGSVLTVEIPTDGSRVYLGGRFREVEGLPDTAELVAVDPISGALDPSFAGRPGREVFDLVATDDGRVYVAEGGPLGRAEAYDDAGALIARWDTNGDVQGVEQIGERIYFGGHDFGPEEEENVAVVDPDDLTIFDTEVFEVPVDSGDGVWTFHATETDLWLGGQHSSPTFGFGRYPPAAPPPPREDVLPAGSTWTYLDDGSDQDTAWRETGFDDSGWSAGPAQLGFGDGDEATVLESGHVTYRFRRTFTVEDASALSDVRTSLLVDDGAVAYVNGTEIVRHNMPGGPIDAQTLASTTAFGPAETTYTTHDVPDGVLVDGVNTFAVEIHQASPSSSDISYDGRLTAVGVDPDVDPPSVPDGLAASAVIETSFTLEWDPSTDDTGVDHYEVALDGVAVGTTASTSYDLAGLMPATAHSMTVAAVDTAGNRSAPSTPLAVTTADAPPPDAELIAVGSVWRYLDDGSDQGSAWRQPGFDESGWSIGPAQLGRGDGDEATGLDGGPLTYWFRRSFSVGSAAAVTALDLDLLVDDGAVVYLNGVEVARDNMPAGAITAATNAVDYRWGAAEQAFRPFSLSTAPLVDGTNVLAVEVHQAPGSSDLSFDATLHSVGGGVGDPTPPSVPTAVVSTGATETSLSSAWQASSDDVGVDHYDVFVDGSIAATVIAAEATVGGLNPSTTYSIEVEAVDGAGNRSGRSAAVPMTTADPPAGGPVTFVPSGSAWRWLDDGVDPGPTWVDAGFDDSPWGVGGAELGFGDGDEATGLAAGQVTYRFRSTFEVASAAEVTALSAELLADDGAVVYLNGVEVVRDNLPAGPIDDSTLASGYRWGSAERTFRPFPLDPNLLVDGTNTIAVEVHQADAGSSDLSFDLEVHGTA